MFFNFLVLLQCFHLPLFFQSEQLSSAKLTQKNQDKQGTHYGGNLNQKTYLFFSFLTKFCLVC